MPQLNYKEIPKGCTHFRFRRGLPAPSYYREVAENVGGTTWDFYHDGNYVGTSLRTEDSLTPIPNDVLMDSFLYHERKDTWKLIRSTVGAVCWGVLFGTLLLALSVLVAGVFIDAMG